MNPEQQTDVVGNEVEAASPRASMIVPRAQGGVDFADLTYRLIRPASASGIDRWRLAEAYRCWKAVWSDTLRELDNAPRVFADDFTRQDELGALFYRERCIGLTAFRWVDLSLEHNRDDSYFKAWPDHAMRALVAEGSKICVGSNLTVLPEWRGSAHGFSTKQVLMVMAVKRFLESPAHAMAGTMRNDRKMNDLVYRLGALPLVKDAVHHGVKVDLVVFSRRAGLDRSPGGVTEAVTDKLWEEAGRLAEKSMKASGGRNHENRAR